MKVLRRHLQACTWFALVAVLALALMPTLSHALAHSRGEAGRWAEVCTPQGMKQVVVGALGSWATDDAAPTPAAASHLENCPYCTLSAQAAVMPPAPPKVPDFSSAAAYLAPLFLQTPRTQFVWRSAQSRGPPAAA